MRRLIILVMLGVLWLPTPVGAQIDELGLTLRPAIIEVAGDAGTTVTTRITIESTSTTPIGVTIGSRSLLPNDPEIDQEKRKLFDAASWILPLQKDLLMTPGQQTTTEIQVVIPPDASPGGHYALITYTPVEATSASSDQTRVKALPEVTSLALITVPGDIKETGYAEAVAVAPINLSSALSGSAQFFNDGNVHVLPTMRAVIYRSNGEAVRTIPLPPQLSLPNTIKTITADWDPEGLSGRFYIEFELDFGTPSQTVTARTNTFLVLPPFGTLLFGASVLLFVGLSLRFAWPKFNRRVLKRKRYQRTTAAAKKRSKAPNAVEPRALDAIVREPKLKNTPQRRKVSPRKPQKPSPQAAPKKKARTKIRVKF